MNLPERSPAPSNARVVTSWLWALCPLWSFGLGTAPAMIWAAVHKRSGWQGLAAAGYLAAAIITLLTVPSGPRPDPVTNVFSIAIVVFVALIHGLGSRRWAFDIPAESFDVTVDEAEVLSKQRAAIAATRADATARSSALRLAEDEPERALRLYVGRIDIPNRAYPDGGLIDVNNVSGPALIKAIGLDESAGARLVEARSAANGFSSVSEASILADLPPRALEHCSDLLVFLPRL